MSQQSIARHDTDDHFPGLLPELGIMCQSLYVIFHQSPTAGQLEMLDGFALFNNHFRTRNNPQAIASLAALQALCQQADAEQIHTLAADYQQLFIGPGDLAAPPWGSVYLHPNKEMFDDSAVEVDRFYRRHGLALDTGVNEPADHIGLMFAFLAWLCARDLDERYSNPGSQRWKAVIGEFTGDYLLTWSGHFLGLVNQRAATPFYQHVAVLADAVIAEVAAYSGAVRKPAIIY